MNMKRSQFLSILVILLLVSFSVVPIAYQSNSVSLPTKSQNQASTQTTVPTFTPTCNGTCPPTFTFTPTPSLTPTETPSCSGYTDVSGNIDGADFGGDDTSSTPSLINLEGYGPNGNVYTFTLASPKTLNFSLCPTEDPNRITFLAIRSSCWDSSTDKATNSGYCDDLSEIVGLSLSAGTYYIVMAEGSGSIPGPYDLRIKSGNIGTVCTVTPVSTPQAVTPGTYNSCSNVYDLNGGNPISTGERVGTGQIDDSINTDDYYSFTPRNNGPVTVTLDCFDNGMCTTDFDIYGFNNCPVGGTPTSVGSSNTTNPVEQFSFTASGGTTYYVDVSAYFGAGTYRLTVQTP